MAWIFLNFFKKILIGTCILSFDLYFVYIFYEIEKKKIDWKSNIEYVIWHINQVAIWNWNLPCWKWKALFPIPLVAWGWMLFNYNCFLIQPHFRVAQRFQISFFKSPLNRYKFQIIPYNFFFLWLNYKLGRQLSSLYLISCVVKFYLVCNKTFKTLKII